MYKRDRSALGRGRSLGRVGAGRRTGTKGGTSDGRAMGLEIGEWGRSRSGLSVYRGAEAGPGEETIAWPPPHESY